MGAGKGKTRRVQQSAGPNTGPQGTKPGSIAAEMDWWKLSQQSKYWHSQKGELLEIAKMNVVHRKRAAGFFMRKHATPLYEWNRQRLQSKLSEVLTRGSRGKERAEIVKQTNAMQDKSPYEWAEELPLIQALRGKEPSIALGQLPELESLSF